MRPKFVIYLILPLVLIVSLYILSNLFFLYPEIQKNIINEKKIMLKELTQVAINAINGCNAMEGDSISLEEKKKLAEQQIRKLNYGKNQKSYFWITDTTPTMIMHPYRPDLEGKNLSNFRDIQGTRLFQNAVDTVAKNGEGFIEYYWQWQDDSTKISPKISYVKLYKKWGWIIGTGVYLDEIDNEFALLRKKEFHSALVILAFLFLLIGLIFQYAHKSEKQRIQALSKLKLSEEKFRNIFNHSNDIIIISNLSGTILDINQNSLETYKLNYNDVVGKKTANLVREDYQEIINSRLKNIEKGPLDAIEIILKLPDNGEIVVETKSSLMDYEGNRVMLSTMRDISIRKTQEKKLIESRLHYKIVADYTCDWEYWLSPEGIFIYISPACKKISGYEAFDFINNPSLYTDIIIPEDLEKWNKHHKNALEYHIGFEVIEFRIKNKAGDIVWLEHSCQPVYDNNNNYIGARGSNRDITIRKGAQEKLLSLNKNLEISEAKFKTLSDVTFEGIAIHENGVVIDINLALLRMFGYKREDLIDKYALPLLFDKESQSKLIESIKSNNTIPYEVTGVRKDGSTFPVEVEGKTYYNEAYGKSLRVTALRDISTRKKNEAEIRKLSTAVEQSANLVLITDINGVIEYANDKFCKTTGYTRAEIIGEKPNILKSGKQDNQFYKNLWETILTGNAWRGELCNKKKNGKFYWESMLITPIFDDNNTISNFMSVKEDITDKKNADTRLFNAVIETEEKERKKFAEDLHDELGPHLSGIRLYINSLEDPDTDPERKDEIIKLLDTLIKEAIDKTRTISNQLMPSILTDYGLLKALDSFCTRINNTHVININLSVNDTGVQFDKTSEVVIYRIIIELINNTIKHARANNIDIDFIERENKINVMYSDDGIGFDLNSKLEQKTGLGLNNILSRLKTIDGTYLFDNIPGKGIIFKFTFLPQKIF